MKQVLNIEIAADYDCMGEKYLSRRILKIGSGDIFYSNSETVASFEHISNHHTKRAGTALYYSALGSLDFGPADAIVGDLCTGNHKINHLAIYFHEGKKTSGDK